MNTATDIILNPLDNLGKIAAFVFIVAPIAAAFLALI